MADDKDQEADNYEDLDQPPPIQWARFNPTFMALALLAVVVGLGIAAVVFVAALTL